MLEHAQPSIDEHVLDLIATRVTAALRAELHSLLALENDDDSSRERGMTVDQVARRLGVTRSTVYAHWREWGGYKLGAGEKAPIRFDAAKLPGRAAPGIRAANRSSSRSPQQTRRRVKRPLISDAPRITDPLNEAA
jgi:transposase-like protein